MRGWGAANGTLRELRATELRNCASVEPNLRNAKMYLEAFARRVAVPVLAQALGSEPRVIRPEALAELKSVKELDAQPSTLPLQDDEPVSVGPVRKLWRQLTGSAIRDGEWSRGRAGCAGFAQSALNIAQPLCKAVRNGEGD